MNNNRNPENENDVTNFFGEVIHSYRRAQAIADGVLVDVTSAAKEAGWKFPTALTAALWADIENIPARYSHEDIDGRLWDVVWMASLSARGAKPGISRFTYELILHREGSARKYTQLVCDCGPGDNAEPVITIGYAGDF